MTRSIHDLVVGCLGVADLIQEADAVLRLAHLVDRFAAIGARAQKPIAFVLGPADSPDESKWRAVEGARSRLTDARLAVYPSVDRAAYALATYVRARQG